MSRKLTFLERILIPLTVAFVVGFIFHKLQNNYFFSIGTFVFALLSKILDFVALDSSEKIAKKAKLDITTARQEIFKDYAKREIDIIRKLIVDKQYKVISLSNLEDSLNEVWRCCSDGSELKMKFFEHKGFIGDSKTTLEKSRIDNEIKIDYLALLENLQLISTSLKEL